MTKHIPIKVMTRLSRSSEIASLGDDFIEFEDGSLEAISDGCITRVYIVSWINKHDTSLDKTFNNPLDQLESLSIR